MTLDIALAATYLVVGYNLSVGRLGYRVEHFKVVVGRARSAMDKQQRSIAGLLADYPIVSFKALERHCASCNLHVM